MNKIYKVFLIFFAVVVVGGSLVSVVLLRKQKQEETGFESEFQELVVENTAEVSIESSGFVPDTLAVGKNTLVVFINNDTKNHTVASDPYPTNDGLPGFDSQTEIEPESSYSFVFTEPGSFSYHDDLNPLSFKGVVVVE